MGVKYTDVIQRMKHAGKLKNDSAVARVLKVTPQALSNYKKRGEMPSDLVVRFSRLLDVSLDWLITGEGGIKRPTGEGNIYVTAAEELSRYGAIHGEAGTAFNVADISHEEAAYIAKLLRIMRGTDSSTSSAVRETIDSFLKSVDVSKEAS